MADMTGIIPLGSEQATATESVRLKQQVDTLKHRLSGGSRDEATLKQACQDFEAVFMGKLWQEMRNTVPKEGYLHSKFEDQYVTLFDQEFSKKMAASGGIGLADMLYSQLKDKLHAASRETAPGAGAALKPLKPEPGALKPLFPEPEPMALKDQAAGIPLAPAVAQAAATAQTAAPDLPSREVREAGLPPDPARLGGAMLQREVDALAARILEQSQADVPEAPIAPVKTVPTAARMSGREFASLAAGGPVATGPHRRR